MILKMKKYSFLVYHKNYIEFLEKIREIGLLHIIEKAESKPEDIKLMEKMQFSARIKNLIRQLENIIPQKDITFTENSSARAEEFIPLLENELAEKENLLHKIATTDKEVERMEVWGDFSKTQLSELHNAGIIVGFYACHKHQFQPEWETKYNTFEIKTIGTYIYFATVTNKNEIIEIDIDPIKLANYTATELKQQKKALEEKLQLSNAKLTYFSQHKIDDLKNLLNTTDESIDFSKALINTHLQADDKVMVLEGFCPENAEKELETFLKTQDAYFQTEEPKLTDNVPIKLKNNRFSKLFEPITNLFSLPNYSELDPTPFFAPFFMLFFGLCLGDGGYGLLVLAAATLLKRKLAANMKGLLTLGQYLGAMTILVGILTGSFFGISLDQVEWTWLKGVKSYFITQANYGALFNNYNPMMIIAVVIGIIQILYGMVVNVLKITKQFGFKYALGNLAWVVFIVMFIVIYVYPTIANPMPTILSNVAYLLAGISVLIIVFYNSPGKNTISNVGSALWNTYNMATGLLGDTLSYIRLFALGLTGSILGGVFNTLAFDLTADASPYLRWVFVLLILLVGHTINFALSMIGAFVHPMRLTFVEFYKNAGFEGGGKAYQPFSKKTTI